MNELNAFGKTLITDVRDRTIRDVDNLISGKYRSSNALKWSKEQMERQKTVNRQLR